MVLKFTVEQVDLVRRLRDTGIGVKDIEIIFNKLADLEASLRKTCDGPPPSERAREPQLTAREVDNSVEDEDYSSSSSDSSTPSSPMPANTTFGTNTGIGTPLNGTAGADCTTVGGASSPEGELSLEIFKGG